VDAPALTPLAVIPSPTQGVWQLGPLPIRAYALCIVLGIIAACVVTEIRLRRRGAPPYTVLDIAVWAVPFGIIGARIYHVVTSPASYFGEGGDFLEAFKIWRGGLGIWGAIAGGAIGAWISARRLGIPLTVVADAMAPGLPLAQAIGRWGNWFNNELYGGETKLPWGLKIYNWDPAQGKAITESGTGEPIVKGIYHPTFLYESLWDIGTAVLVWQLDKRYKFGRGRAFALYAMAYCVGRFWIEAMRTDEASHFLGMRLNNWTALVVFAGALVYFLRVRGPQERIVVDEDGKVTVVAGDAAETPAETADETATAAHDDTGDDTGPAADAATESTADGESTVDAEATADRREDDDSADESTAAQRSSNT
jgi:prolipoprotein diacylglyceryl transferase